MKVTRSLKKGMIIAVATGAFLWQGAYAQEVQPKKATFDVGADQTQERQITPEQTMRREAMAYVEGGGRQTSVNVLSDGSTVLEALNRVVQQYQDDSGYGSLRTDLLSENEYALLTSVTNTYATPEGHRVALDEALRKILTTFKLKTGKEIAFTFDGRQAVLGSPSTIDGLVNEMAVTSLANNHTPIDVNFKNGGVALVDALSQIENKAGITINPGYLGAEFEAYARSLAGNEMTNNVSDVGGAGNNEVKKTYYSTGTIQTLEKDSEGNFKTEPRKIEWRLVLRDILTPLGYIFIEENGSVIPMTKARYADLQKEKVNARPLVTKIVRLRHADPESLAKQLNDLHITKHGNAYIKVAQPKKDKTKTYSGGAAGMSIPSGTKVGASSVGSGNFGNLERPSTPPALLIADVEENIPVIEERIAQLDVRERQILIEALILNVDDDTSQALGVEWSGLKEVNAFSASWQKGRWDNSSRVHIDNYKANNSANSSMSRSYADGTTTKERTWNTTTAASMNEDAWGQGTYGLGDNGLATTFGSGLSQVSERINKTLFSGLVGPINLAATLNLVEECGKDQVLSSPVLTMGDHTESIILVGDAHPVAIVRNSYVQDRTDMAQEIEWQIVMSGVTLWVAPEITDDGKSVRLSVHPQITKVTGWEEYRSELLGLFRYPIIQSRELDTRVTVPDGNTLVLGGLIDNENLVKKGKVWLLGDIPLLGRLFRWENTTEVRKNLMILIRPTILDDEEPETKFDEPSMRTIDPMLDTNMKLLGSREEKPRDPMRENEEKIIRYFKHDKNGEMAEVAEAEAVTDGEAAAETDGEPGVKVEVESPVVADEVEAPRQDAPKPAEAIAGADKGPIEKAANDQSGGAEVPVAPVEKVPFDISK